MHEIYKNDVITPYEDAGGVTNTARAGETRLGTDYFTGEELETTDKIISRRYVCDRCGCPPDGKLTKQAGWMVCGRCIDG